MQIEYEATYPGINKDETRERLVQAGAELVKPEFTLKRHVFYLPKGNEIENGFLRVRDEGDKVTMSLKIIGENHIENQREICLTVSSFEQASEFLKLIGCQQKAYQETKREVWQLDGVEIDVDEWPFLEPFVEIEGESEAAVRSVSDKLGFDYSQALFCSAGLLYSKKYDLPFGTMTNRVPLLNFEMDNPFLKLQEEFRKR